MMSDRREVPFERLLDWLEGQLSEEEATAIEKQVGVAGAGTQDVVAWLRAFQQVSEDVVLGTPPRSVHEALRRRFRSQAAGQRRPGILRRLAAALTFDSSLQPALAGVRSPGSLNGADQARQLIYQTEVAEIALNLQQQPGDAGFDLLGQVYPLAHSAPPHFSVQFLCDGDEIALTTTDELGEFFFQGVQLALPNDLASGAHTIIVCNN